MICKNCGNEMPEGTKFCGKCGAPMSAAPVQGAETADLNAGTEAKKEKAAAPVSPAPKKKGSRMPLILAAVLALVLCLGAGGFFLLKGGKDSGQETQTTGEAQHSQESASKSSQAAAQESTQAAVEETPAPEITWRDVTPLYAVSDVPVIDIYAQNYTPGQKAPGMDWDGTIFYWLEDIDQESPDDGYLGKCVISRILMRRADTGALVEYEVYRDPVSAAIYKIVSIEDMGDYMALTDYYYAGDAPNFIFMRNDSVYTPTYATPAKVGERFYFTGDVMTGWRMIREPNVIGEYVLTPGEVNYSQAGYFAETQEIRDIYDQTEVRMLNAARNTYNAVVNAGNGVGLVEGYVRDTTGSAAAGVTVDLLGNAEQVKAALGENAQGLETSLLGEDAVLYRSVTDENGYFQIYVNPDGTAYTLAVRGEEPYGENRLYGICLTAAESSYACGNVVLHRLDGDEYPVHMDLYAATLVDRAEGTEAGNSSGLLAGAQVTLRAGAGAKEGEAVAVLTSNEAGAADVTLPSGTYTAQIQAEGYADSYVTVEVADQAVTVSGYLMPAVPAGQTGVLLTWEGNTDLDLTLFTPWQASEGDMARIGGGVAQDSHGNRLVRDNATGCEVMYVNTSEQGNYKLYVNDYTDSQTGNYTQSLEGLNIHIYLYDSTGLLAEYTFPLGESGVVWEVADLTGGRPTPSQRVYASLEGKSWWTGSKWELNLEECPALVNLMNDLSNNHGIYEGNWVNAAWLIYGMNDQPFLFQNQPENIELLKAANSKYEENFFAQTFTKEQLEYLIYSITGSKREIQDLNAWSNQSDFFVEVVGNGIAMRYGAGDDGIHFLKNLASEYAGEGKWKVTADCMYSGYETEPIVQSSVMTFTVIRNPDSCFDGYSVLSVEEIPTDNSGWAKAYIEKIVELDSNYEYDAYCAVIPIDEDNIPELIYEGDGLYIYTWKDGQIKTIADYWSTDGGYEFLPYTRIFRLSASGNTKFEGEVFYERFNSQYETERLLTITYEREDLGYNPIYRRYDAAAGTSVDTTEQELQSILAGYGVQPDSVWMNLHNKRGSADGMVQVLMNFIEKYYQ